MIKWGRLFKTVFYLVEAERRFSDFFPFSAAPETEWLSLTYSNDKQAKVFFGFIAEEIRSLLIQSLQDEGIFCISFDSNTDKGNIEEEMIQVRVLENNKNMFVTVKPLSKADAANTVSAVVEALERDCEHGDKIRCY